MKASEEMLELADELAVKLILVEKLVLSATFDYTRLGEVSCVRTSYIMNLSSQTDDAILHLLSDWPLDTLGYGDPDIDLDCPPLNVTLQRHGTTISRVSYNITIRGECFKRKP